ncbi:MAG: ATP-binding protein [Pseudonocardiales bacterium]|nr:ATP-binding protein [Pseudonocardiales bacterium]
MRETEELAESLRSAAEQATAAMLLVVGPSGCGKSSLVRAGLAHVMARNRTGGYCRRSCRALIPSRH